MEQIEQDTSTGTMTRAIEQNLFAIFADLAAWNRVEVCNRDHVMYLLCEVPFGMFNSVFRFSPREEDVETRLDEIVGAHSEREVPALWWLSPSCGPADLEKHLTRRGLMPAGTVTGMALDLRDLNTGGTPAGVTVERVRDAAAFEPFLDVIVPGYGFPEWVRGPFQEALPALGFDGRFRHYLARLDGRPVATASVYFGAGVAGIYDVSTLADVRGRGIGGAVTVAPLLDARDLGYRIGILHATDMGLPVYRRLGFRDYFPIRNYFWPGKATPPAS